MSVRQQYFAYKAQAWLNYANHRDSMNNRSDVGMEAAQTAENILQALKMIKLMSLHLLKTFRLFLRSCDLIYGQL